MKKLLLAGIVGSMALATAAQAAVIPTISLSINYLGSTTQSLSTLGKPNASAPPGSVASGITLTKQDFTTAAGHANTLNHWFEVDMSFSPATADEDFQNLAFDLTTAANLTKVDKTGSAAGTAKWYADNPTDPNSSNQVFSGDADAGTAGDLLAISVQQSNNLNAALTQTGEAGSDQPVPIPLGWFVLKTADNASSTISTAETFGNNVGYFINNTDGNGTAVSTAVGFTSTGYTIPAAGATPEPASIGLLGLGALGLIRRRRQA